MLVHLGHCLVILLACCCHFGALDDCHGVGIVLRMLVHVGHVVAILLWFCCHCGALADCHVVVILLSCGCCLVILLSFC